MKMGIAVIGGGVAGISAALDLADSGYKVYLIEKNAELGGKMAELAECKTGLSPRIVKIQNHPNIELMLSSELEGLSGSAGNFKLKVSGGKEIEVESVVLAPGYDIPDSVATSYGYGSPDVVTSLEFERMLRAATISNELKRQSDGKPVKKIGFIKCVGSRCQDNEICSTACCAYTAKEVWVVKERFPDIDVYVFYMDVRVFGKDEELVADLKDNYGVHYIRSRVPEVLPEGDKLIVKYEDLRAGKIEKLELDMVVLAVGLLPARTLPRLAELTGVKTDEYGYIETSISSPMETSVRGIFACGTATAPMKVRESVGLASGAALKAALMSQRTERIPGQEERKYIEVKEDEPPKVGVFICDNEGEISKTIDIPALAERVKGLRDVVAVNSANTIEEALKALESGIVDQGLNRVVFAGCSPREYEDIIREGCAKAGLNPYLVELVNLREQCAWVFDKNVTDAAFDILRMAVERAKRLEPIIVERYPVVPRALVIGGGISGMNAALDIADAGYEVYLVEKGEELGGGLRDMGDIAFPGGESASKLLKHYVDRVTSHERIKVYTKAREEDVRGRAGMFKARIVGDGVDEEIEFGACVIATGAKEYVPEGYYGYGSDNKVCTLREFEKSGKVQGDTVVIIQDVGPGLKEGAYSSKASNIEAVNAALKIKEENPGVEVFVLYREVKTYGKWEVLYKRAREKGVLFLRYEKPPEYKNGIISVFDVIFNDEIQIKPDMVILSVPMVPAEDNKRLSMMFKIPLKRGFFMEEQERPKMVLTPVDTVNEGVFVCGSAVYPAMIDECIAMSSAAAGRACVLLAKDFMETPAIRAVVNDEVCVGCGVCVQICPVEAIELTEEQLPVVTFGVETLVGGERRIAKVGDGCIGCGSCASYCPSGAMSLQHFRDKQVYAQLDYA